MKSAEVWSGLAEWIPALAAVATSYPEEMKNKHSRKGKSKLLLLMAAATFQRYQWYLNNARLRSTVACQQAALLGTGTCGNEVLHAEVRGVFRQAFHVSVPTFRLKLGLFKLSKQVSFDGARRIPLLRRMNQGPVVLGQGVQGAAGSVRTHNDRELEVQFGQKCPIMDAESSALPASETAGQKSGEFDNEDLPSSASGEDHALHAGFGASVHHTRKRRQQRNREGNS